MTRTAIIMAAPNGARKTRSDHPNLPVSIDETVMEAARCFAAGATILHAHVRGDHGEHVLDPVRYRQLFRAMEEMVPDMLLQMTTEAVGIYAPEEQVDCVHDVRPGLISLAVREIAGPGADMDLASGFYHWAHHNRVHVQHIVYDAGDLDHLLELQQRGLVPEGRLCVLFVLGRYLENRESEPSDMEPFLLTMGNVPMDWFVCAFGSREQQCVLAAIEAGGHARVGFENNLLRPDGKQAMFTAEQVAALKWEMEARGFHVADVEQTSRILGLDDMRSG